MLEKMTSISVENGLSRGKGDKHLKRTCAEFESIFLTYMLKSRRGSLVEDGLLGNSHESQMVNSIFDENLAIGIARNGGIGIGNMLYERLTDSGSDNRPGNEPQTVPPLLKLGFKGHVLTKPSTSNGSHHLWKVIVINSQIFR